MTWEVLLSGLDHFHSLQSDYLLGAHGPPVSGREAIAQAVTRYRDSIQFMWDQTDVLASPPETFVHTLRVILDPARSGDRDEELAWRFTPGGEQTGLHLRHGIAAITDGSRARIAIELALPTWARILAGKTGMSDARWPMAM